MNTQIINVYYGSDALPYKDRERKVHFPITGSTFIGSSDTTKIRFYVDNYLASPSALWISVSKRADGIQGSQFLTTGTDSNGDKYREMTLTGWYTEKKGDLYISLKGYQGGSTGHWDSETGMYIVEGVPVIRATGSIKLAINYAPVGEYPNWQDEIAAFEDLVAQLGNKLDITDGIVVVDDISLISTAIYSDGQLVYDKTTKALYIFNLNQEQYQLFFETYDKGTLDTKFSGKVDKKIETGFYAYTHYGATQMQTPISKTAQVDSLAMRDESGSLQVATPTSSSHATTKDYVDDSIGSARTYLLGVINDAGHSLGLVESTDPSKEYDYIIQLKDKAGNVISSVELDLPLEQIITSGYYDEDTKSVVLVLDNGSEVVIPVGDLVEGLIDQQALNQALEPYIEMAKVSSVLTTGDLITNIGIEKSFVLDVMGDLFLCYISETEQSGNYTMSVIGKHTSYTTQQFTNSELVINILGTGILDTSYLPIITLTQPLQTLTSEQMQVANQDNSIIKYVNRLYHKCNVGDTSIEFISIDYDIVDEGANHKLTKYEITVNKTTGATNEITSYVSFYNVGEIDDLLQQKANVNGEYPNMTVGKSLTTKQIENISDEVGSTQTAPFLFQATGTADNTSETPTAPVAKHLELRGNTVVFNQLVDIPSSDASETLNGITLTDNRDGSYTLDGTASADTVLFRQVFFQSILGHKYLFGFKNLNSAITGLTFVNGNQTSMTTGTMSIVEAENSNNFNIEITVVSGTQLDNVKIIPQVIDLTLMYGVGYEIETPLQYIRDYPQEYYAKNNGTLKSCKSIKLISIGYNQFDGTWNVSGNYRYSNYIEVIGGQTYTLEQDNEIVDSKRIEEYDANKNFIKETYRDSEATLVTLTLTKHTKYVIIRYTIDDGNIKNCCFHLTWDSSKTGYEEYVKHEYDIPEVQLKSVGSVCDTITSDGTYTQKIGSRAYESGDENDASVRTDLTNTYYVLSTPIVTYVDSFAENIIVDDFGTMQFVASEESVDPIIPQGNKFFYPADYVLFIDDLYNRSKDGGQTSDANNFVLQSQLANVSGDAENLAEEYNSSTTYAIGNLVIHDNKLYKCTTAITTAENWNITHWTATTIENEFATKNYFGFKLISTPASIVLTADEITNIVKGCQINGNFSSFEHITTYPANETSTTYRGTYIGTNQYGQTSIGNYIIEKSNNNFSINRQITIKPNGSIDIMNKSIDGSCFYATLGSSNIGSITSTQITTGWYKNVIAITGGLTNAKDIKVKMSNSYIYTPTGFSTSEIVIFSGVDFQDGGISVSNVYYKDN